MHSGTKRIMESKLLQDGTGSNVMVKATITQKPVQYPSFLRNFSHNANTSRSTDL